MRHTSPPRRPVYKTGRYFVYFILWTKLKKMELERRLLIQKLKKTEEERDSLARSLATNSKTLQRVTREKEIYIAHLHQLLAERTATIAELEEQLGHPITREHMQVMLSRHPDTERYLFTVLSVCVTLTAVVLYMLFQYPLVRDLAADKHRRDRAILKNTDIISEESPLERVGKEKEVPFAEKYYINPDSIPEKTYTPFNQPPFGPADTKQ